MKIMTSNIWGDYFGNPIEVREDGLYEVYMKYSPDIIGFQEVTRGWYGSEMMKKLSRDYYFIGTELCDNSNYVPFIYKKTAGLRLLSKGYEYLCHTPDESKGITWAVFDSEKGVFGVCNTHFWWKVGDEHDCIRVKNAEQLAALMKHLHGRYSCPIFAFGDMNTTVKSGVFEVYAQNGIAPLYDIAEKAEDISSYHFDPIKGEDEKYHGFPTDNDHTHSIDHIVVLGDVKIRSYNIITDKGALDATDHSPVMAEWI